MEYARYGEEIMVDGPFYVNGLSYWIVDYIKRGEVQASLVYDSGAMQFVADRAMMQRAFATREFKDILMADPLFYAVGDPSVIPLGSQYAAQNIRNFAAFAPLTDEERVALEDFLKNYEGIHRDIAECIYLTNSLLRPKVDIKISYEGYPPKILIEVQDEKENRFSYERCQQLLDAYEKVYAGYSQLLVDLDGIVGDLDDIVPGTVIREKHGLVVTKETVIEELDLLHANGQAMRVEIDSRRDILYDDYADQISTAEKRLGIEADRNLKIGIILAVIIIVLLLRHLRKRPHAISAILLSTMILLSIAPVHALEIPSPDELISRRITDPSQVQIRIFADGIGYETARSIIEGYPLILEGEDVYVSGPYYHEGQTYHLFDIVSNGTSTGNLMFVDASTLRRLGSYRIIDQLMKTYYLADLVQRKPLYQAVDADVLEDEALKTNESTMAVFLVKLAENVREGKELEQKLIEAPDFETARDLARCYRRAHMILSNMERLTTPSNVENLTHGFATKSAYLEAYSLVMRYTLTDDHLVMWEARYRGRSLSRIPMMQELAAAGLYPSRLQVVNDLSTDLIYGSPFLWHLGRMEPPLFARMPLKLGDITAPGEYR